MRHRRARKNPDASELATDLTTEAVKAAGRREAAKGAVVVAAKMSGKAIPGVGEALIAYEGSRSAFRDMRGIQKKGKEVRKKWSSGKHGEAAQEWVEHVAKESFLMGPRTGIAGLTTAEVAERFIPRSNPRTVAPPGFEVNFYEGDWVIFDVAHDWTVGQLFESKDAATTEAWRIFDLEQKSVARREKIRAIPGAKHGRSTQGMVSLSHSFKARKAKRNPDPIEQLKRSGLLSRMIGLRIVYQQLHWNAKSYSNHLLFERLYKSLDESIDTLAELLLAYGGKMHGSALTPVLSEQPSEDEEWIISTARNFSGQVTLDIDNFLMNLMQERRRALYLLRQA